MPPRGSRVSSTTREIVRDRRAGSNIAKSNSNRDDSSISDHDDLRSTRSYGVVADRSFTSIALVMDPDGEAARQAISHERHHHHPHRTRAMRAGTVAGDGGGGGYGSSDSDAHFLTVEDIAAMSPTTRARSDVNAAAVASGFDFRYVPPHTPTPSSSSSLQDESITREHGARPTRKKGKDCALPARPYEQSVVAAAEAKGDMGTSVTPSASDSDVGQGNTSRKGLHHRHHHTWQGRFAFDGNSRLVAAASNAAAVDNLLFTLGEVTYNVLAYFFPDGYPSDNEPQRQGRQSCGEGSSGSDDDGNDNDVCGAGEEALHGGDAAAEQQGGGGIHRTQQQQQQQDTDDASGGAERDGARSRRAHGGGGGGRPDVYRLPFLDAEDARAPTTLPPEGLTSASDDADGDTSHYHLLRLLARLALPVAVTQLLRTSMGIITTAFMGNYLSTEQFAAASTGLAFTNLTALNIGNGFSAALDTLATQEHGREKHSPEIVAILVRGMVCTFTVYIPIAVFYFFCEPLLAAVIHPDLVADTAYFLRMSVFIATPMIINNNLIKFAQAQKVTQLGLISSTVGIVLLLPLLFLFRDGGLPGIICALSINRFLVLAVVVYSMLRNKGLARCWRGRTLREHLTAIFRRPDAFWHFVCIGLPILGANCADSWGFEALGIIAAHIGATTTAAWSVIMAIYSQLFALHIGIAVAAAIRIGNAVGARKGLLARRYVLSTIIFSLGCTGFCVAAMWGFGKAMFGLLQRNPEVTERGGEISFLAGCTFFVDSFFYVLQGPYRGVGYNGVLLFIVAGSMWGVTVPLGMVFGVMMRYDVEGILVALLLGMSTGVPVQVIFLLWGVPWAKYDHKDARGHTNKASLAATVGARKKAEGKTIGEEKEAMPRGKVGTGKEECH